MEKKNEINRDFNSLILTTRAGQEAGTKEMPDCLACKQLEICTALLRQVASGYRSLQLTSALQDSS